MPKDSSYESSYVPYERHTQSKDNSLIIQGRERKSSSSNIADVRVEDNKSLDVQTFNGLEKFMIFLNVILQIILTVLIIPLAFFWPFRTIQQYQKGFFLRFGKSRSGSTPLSAGLCICLPCDTLYLIDMRQRTFDIPTQRLLTGDSVAVTIDGVVFWRVENPWRALMDAEKYEYATIQVASVWLRNVLSSKTLHEVLKDREEIAEEICKMADEETKRWGVHITTVQINDVRLPENMQKSMAAEAEATREAAAKVAAAHGELASSKLISEAAMELEQGGPQAIKVRYLNAIQEIASHSSNTVLFPIPSFVNENNVEGAESTSNSMSKQIALMKAANMR